jgi:lipid II isoglutaminyl synthase (glutamine-hydrolysing)
MMRLAAGVAAAKAVGTLARTAGRGGGTSLPGKVLTRVEPHAIGRLARRLDRGSVVISATNGKTTTAAMVASILERTGARLVHNRAGANMAGGVASALAAAARRGGRTLTGDLGLFEVDEFWLGPVVEELEPRAMLLGNLFRDQLDRYGELETIADRWAAVVAKSPATLVLNADDPLVADLGRGRDAGAPGDSPGGATPAVFFGVDDDSLALPALQHASDSKHCRRCGHAYAYEAIYLAHLGHYRCPNCGQQRPAPSVTATDVRLRGIHAAEFTLRGRRVELPLPGLYNVYNALGAAALTLSLGVPLDDVVAGLRSVAPAFGRAETLDLGGRPTSILLVKNPAGANEVLRTLALEGDGLDLLGVLNDRTADGRDVSWVWDADWELLAPKVGRMTCSGTRAAELALRMKYAGLAPHRLRVVDDLEAGLDAALQGDGPLYVIPTYTALLELRELLTRRGQAEAYWR